MENKRVYQIDLFRFIAALCVVFYHYLFRGWAGDDMSEVSFNGIGHFFRYGFLGVDFFFIISGFVISLSIKHNSIYKFIVSRFTRLYPIYWVSVILTFLVVIYFGAPRYYADFRQFIFNLTMFQNYVGIRPIDGVYWTLFVEMKFYIFIVGTFLLINKIKKIDIEYVLIIWLVLTIFYIPFSDVILFKKISNYLILDWSSYFIAGMIFYQIYKNGISKKYVIFLFITFMISLYFSIMRLDYFVNNFQTTFSPYVIGLIIFTFYILMYMVTTNKMNYLNSPKLIQLGMLTYPLYLIHQNIGFIIFNNLHYNVNKYLLLLFTILLMLTLSYVLSRFYEPIISNYLKNKLLKIYEWYKK